MMKKEFKLLYGVLAVIVLAISTIGATYAYWTASTKSANNEVETGSTIYSISMQINPLYHDFSVIPMDDENALKALKNKCKDKYDRGACSAYTIYVYDYNADLDYISGYITLSLICFKLYFILYFIICSLIIILYAITFHIMYYFIFYDLVHC